MTTDDIDETYDEELYTDTSMFDAEEIVRSVEQVARNHKSDPESEHRLSARRRFEKLMEDRELAESISEPFEDDWPDEDEL